MLISSALIVLRLFSGNLGMGLLGVAGLPLAVPSRPCQQSLLGVQTASMSLGLEMTTEPGIDGMMGPHGLRGRAMAGLSIVLFAWHLGVWIDWVNIYFFFDYHKRVLIQLVDYFGTGDDGRAWHEAYSDGSWGPYETLGGTFISPVTINTWGSNNLDFFGVGNDNACWHKHFDGSSWSSWDSRGGNFIGEIQAISISVSVIDIVGIGSDSALHHAKYDGSSWGDWENLGGSWTSTPAVAAAGGGFHVFTIGSDNAMHHRAWSSSGGWEDWESIGGSFSSAPTVVSTTDGFQCFGLGTDSNVYQKTWGLTSDFSSSWVAV